MAADWRKGQTLPELPEVEIYRRRLQTKGLRRRIDAVGVQTPRILQSVSARDFSARLIGARLESARRHGKRLYAALDGGGWVAMHFGLTGDLQVYRDSDPQPPYARVVLDLTDGRRIAYINRRMIGRVGLVEDMAADVRAKKLGPDALDPRLTAAAFKKALAGRRGPIKSVLMDQEVIAGIGNEYSDEILFQARVHPTTPASALDARALGRIYNSMRRILEQALAAGADHARFPKTFLIPNRRQGAACPRCGGQLRRVAVGGRTGYFCPACQSKPGSG